MSLSIAEIEFLRQHGISPSDLYDARGKPNRLWRAEAKLKNYRFVIGATCYNGHRFRSTAGHCIQCNTARIAFTRRECSDGYVYLASACSGRMIKIGSTVNISDRQKSLIGQRYGGYSDWKINCSVFTSELGKVEREFMSLFSGYRSTGYYWKENNYQEAKEIFAFEASQAIAMFREKSERWGRYSLY
jgi:hypothetical protein